MEHEKIVTMYETQAQADGAKRSLIKAGFKEHDIDIISGARLKEEGHDIRHPGFWQRLFGKSLDEEQSEVYEDALRTGGSVLTLRAKEDELPRAYSIIDAHDTTGITSPEKSGTLLDVDETNGQLAAENTSSSRDVHSDPVRTYLTGDETEEEVLRLAEERLEIGKRLVSEGATRVRRYTVTDQVSDTISLHEQHADIFRHNLDHQISEADVDWDEKVVEVEETHERPVVNKTVHVTEEVVVRKDESDRQEQVTDSVRRQEVDIEHKTKAGDVNPDLTQKQRDSGLATPVPGRDKSADLSAGSNPQNDSNNYENSWPLKK